MEQQPQKKSHKKFWIICAAIILVLTCAVSCNTSNNNEAENNKVVTETAKKDGEKDTSEKSEEKKSESSGKLGDYEVTILDSVVTKDYEGNPALIVNYTFTNNSDDATMFTTAISSIAYQDGVQLSPALIMDTSVYNAENSMKNVQKGGTINCQEAYELTSETSSVTVEVKELFSFDDNKLTKVFELN